jgi:poly(hydroxyalkanoate) depolymerase family esterase
LKINRSLLARLRGAIPLAKTLGSVRRLDPDAIAKTIHQALASAGLQAKGPESREAPTPNWRTPGAAPEPGTAPPDHSRPSLDDALAWARGRSRDPGRREPIDLEHAGVRTGSGEFLTRSFSNDAGTRSYKLYVPSSYSSASDEAVALVVMLHGCTQSPDDFAAGTRMNALAERHGFLVVYPAQAPNANGSKCWNWFRGEDQRRDRGEPSLIAGITREVAAAYRIDERKIFVAGLSAGAAMAVILGATYPDIYAAVGAHSGLPYGSAHDVPSAFGAMKGNGARSARPGPFAGNPAAARADRPMPTIVFHGDSDQTVVVQNGDAIVEHARSGFPDQAAFDASVNHGAATSGRTWRRTVYADSDGHPVVEHWLVHGAGHAWSGGSPEGTFTDGSGPDASAEMIRFFHARARARKIEGDAHARGFAN